MSRPSPRMRQPFACKLTMLATGVPVGLTTDRIRAPKGWVFGDIRVNFSSTNFLRWAMSPDRNYDTYRDFNTADMDLGALPMQWDFDTPSGWYPSSSTIWEWRDIGFAEIRTIFADNSDQWSNKAIQICGVLVPDPRRYVR